MVSGEATEVADDDDDDVVDPWDGVEESGAHPTKPIIVAADKIALLNILRFDRRAVLNCISTPFVLFSINHTVQGRCMRRCRHPGLPGHHASGDIPPE